MSLRRTLPPVVALVLSLSSAAWCQQYTEYGNPTAAEQQVLEYINRARANPTAEGTRLGIVITEGFTAAQASDTGPRPPLAMNVNLLATARAHSEDMWTRDYFAHDTLSPPTQTWAQRIAAGGYSGSMLAENIATGSNHTAVQLEDLLMLDSGYPGRGHRINLLDVNEFSTTYMREIGVGYYVGSSNKTNVYKDVLTEDFGRRSSIGPLIVGVVYNDTNTNNFYDPGEGMAGVTVRFNGGAGAWAVTASAGGFAFPYTGSGSIVVEATGGAFGTTVVQKTITRNGENVKVDFKLSDASVTDSDGDGLPDAWEMAHFGNLSQNGSGDFDGDGATNLAEFNAGSDPSNPASTPSDTDGDGLPDAWEMAHFGSLSQTATGNPDGDSANNLAEYTAGTDPMDPASFPGSGTPAPSSTKSGGHGGGGCGLTGFEALILLGLLRRRRLK